MRKYTDIFIDFDDTLYDTRGNAIIALEELYEWAQLGDYFDSPQVFYDAYWKTNLELWGQYARGEIDRQYLIVERFRRPLSVGRGLNPTVEYCLEVSDKFLDLCASKPGTIEGAHDLLSYLKDRGYRLHMASNGFHEVQYHKLASAQMTDYFDTIILSEDAGANKPSAQFFDYALKKTGAVKETSLMIGDNYNTDILGAKNAGIDAMLFRRWGRDFVPPQPVEYVVDELCEIKDYL